MQKTKCWAKDCRNTVDIRLKLVIGVGEGGSTLESKLCTKCFKEKDGISDFITILKSYHKEFKGLKT